AANEAISVGRAPRTGRGFRARRALAATRLPRPVAFGLGTPLARPARAAGTVVAVALGATTLVFAVGLTASLSGLRAASPRVGAGRVGGQLAGRGRARARPGARGGPVQATTDVSAVRATVAAEPGTAHQAGEVDINVHAAGVTGAVTAETYTG